MANTLITPSIIAKEALLWFENNMVFGGLVHRDYKKEFVKIGSKVSIRKPVKFVASDGATRVNQNVSESTTDITINKRKHVSWTFSMQDLTLTVAEYNKRYIQPACAALANIVDSDLADLHSSFFMNVGTPGSAPSTFAVWLAAMQKADEQLWPRQNRSIVLNPRAKTSLLDSLDANIFSEKLTEDAIMRGACGKIVGMPIYEDANIKTFTPGTVVAGDTTIFATNPTTTTITVTGSGGTHTWKVGDLFTIGGVYDINPMSRDAYRHLKQFVITEAVTESGGAATLTFYPAIITSGAYQTVSAAPEAGAAVVKPGTIYTDAQDRNMCFHKNAMALVMVPLELPQGAAFKARETYKNLSIRVVKDYDIEEDEDIIRLDIMYGVKCIYPELSCLIFG